MEEKEEAIIDFLLLIVFLSSDDRSSLYGWMDSFNERKSVEGSFLFWRDDGMMAEVMDGLGWILGCFVCVNNDQKIGFEAVSLGMHFSFLRRPLASRSFRQVSASCFIIPIQRP